MLGERYGPDAPPADELAEMISGQVVALDLPARSLADLASQTETRKPDLLLALEPLVDASSVVAAASAVPNAAIRTSIPLVNSTSDSSATLANSGSCFASRRVQMSRASPTNSTR